MVDKKEKWSISIFVCSLIVISWIVFQGCGDSSEPEKPEPNEVSPNTSRQLPSIDSELTVLWEHKRGALDFSSIYKDLKKNGVPGGGSIDDIQKITFHKSDGTVFVVDIKGKEILPCAAMVDGKIVPIVIDFKRNKIIPTKDGEICENLTDTNIIGIRQRISIDTHKSPDCPVEAHGGYLVQRCR